MLLSEVLNKPYPYKWNSKGSSDWFAEFHLDDGGKIDVMFQKSLKDENVIELVFSRSDKKNRKIKYTIN